MENLTKARISQISTNWDEIFAAHQPDEGHASPNERNLTAQVQVIKRYAGSIYQYLLGATRDSDLADELSQEFAFRFIRGDLSNADPSKGRFRDYLKQSLRNLIYDFHRGRSQEHNGLKKYSDVAIQKMMADLESTFRNSWRDEIIRGAWDELQRNEQRNSNRLFTVLHFRAEHPELSSDQMAERLSVVLDQPVTAAWVRQKLHRARRKFGKFVVAEVQKTIADETNSHLRDELAELGLLEYLEKEV